MRGQTYSPSNTRGEVNGVAPPAIELRGIDKWFGEVHANRDVSLAVHRGTIHGIVGENGAGKSTLMGILYGYYQPDRGEILVRGRPAAIRSAQDALAAGIGIVHQHFMLVQSFTVLENVVLGMEGGFRLGAGLARPRAELQPPRGGRPPEGETPAPGAGSSLGPPPPAQRSPNPSLA